MPLDRAGLKTALRNAVRILLLDRAAISDVASSPDSTKNAVIILFLASVAQGINGIFWTGSSSLLTAPVVRPSLLMLLQLVLTSFVTYLSVMGLGILVMHLIALALGGRAGYRNIFSPVCYQMITACLITACLVIIPFIGLLFLLLLGLWSLVVDVVILETVHQLSRKRAVMVVLIQVILNTFLFLTILLHFLA